MPPGSTRRDKRAQCPGVVLDVLEDVDRHHGGHRGAEVGQRTREVEMAGLDLGPVGEAAAIVATAAGSTSVTTCRRRPVNWLANSPSPAPTSRTDGPQCREISSNWYAR